MKRQRSPTGARPIETHPTPDGAPAWGLDWKKAIARDYLKTTTIATHGAVMAHRGNYLDLDPTYKDALGRPLLRMTFDYTDNEHKMSDYLTDRAAEYGKAMGGRMDETWSACLLIRTSVLARFCRARS